MATSHTVRIVFEDERVAWVVIEDGDSPEVSVRGLRNVVGIEYEREVSE